MSAYLARMLKRHNVKILTGISVTEVAPGEKMKVTFSDGRVLETEGVLVAAGRAPNVEGTGLKEIGLDVAKGSLSVNDRMETAIPGIYAAGDVIGGWLLAHVAFSEGIVAGENAAGMESRMDYRVVPPVLSNIRLPLVVLNDEPRFYGGISAEMIGNAVREILSGEKKE